MAARCGRREKVSSQLFDLVLVADKRRLVPISNHLLPPVPQITQAEPAPAPFKRPEPLKRSSLPFTSSAPSSPIRDVPEEVRRAPSPETIARMSMVGPQIVGSSSRNGSLDRPSVSRSGSLDNGAHSPKPQRKTSLSHVELADPPRPRSPKPEADGKLDRKFKFPLKSPDAISPVSPTEQETISPKSAITSTVPSEPPSAISAVLAQEPGPASTEDALEPAIDVNGDAELPAAAEESDPVDIGKPVIGETSVEEPEAIVADVPLTSEPVQETLDSTTSPTINAHSPDDKHVAHTIDEAIADFQTAVKTPEPESLQEPEGLSAVEIDDTSVPVAADEAVAEEESGADAIANCDAEAAINGTDDQSGEEPLRVETTIEEAALASSSHDDISATAPRRVSRTPQPPQKDTTVTSDHETGEGNTMEDIDID